MVSTTNKSFEQPHKNFECRAPSKRKIASKVNINFECLAPSKRIEFTKIASRVNKSFESRAPKLERLIFPTNPKLLV